MPDGLAFTLSVRNAARAVDYDDPDVLFARALAAGAREIYAVADQPYGWRLGRLVDPFGHHWEIGKPIRQ